MTESDPFAALERAAAEQAIDERARRAVVAARSRLLLARDPASAFFATLALRLAPFPDRTCPTAATDGHFLQYNPAFVDGLSADELVGVVVHEVLHTALAHHARRGGRDASRWNAACDLAVNPLLLDSGFQLPAGRLVPGEGEYAHLPVGQTAEAYYAWLDGAGGPGDSPAAAGGGPGGTAASDPGGCGGVTEPAGGSPAEVRASEQAWRSAVALAASAARGRGELPAGLARQVERVVHPPLDWAAVLRQFVAGVARNDYSWTRPNRRFLSRGLYLPGLYSDELGEVVIAVDTSGSVGDREVAAFAAEVNAVLDAYPCTATVLAHDRAVQSVQAWRSGDGPLALRAVGGGGTSHVCVFDWVRDAGIAPACVLCLTDLLTEFPRTPPDLPVLWAVIGRCSTRPPFGTRIDLTP